MYKITKLDNGLTIASQKIPKASSVSLGVWIKVGGRYENAAISGVSHFLEHMVFKGTKKRTYQQIKEAVEGVGGMLNAFTSEEFTCYYVKILAKHLNLSIDVLLDMVLMPLFDPAELKKEKQVIFEEIKMYEDLPHHVCYEKFAEIFWPQHPLGRNLAGNFRSLKKINRRELSAYRDKYYILPNMLVTACGNVRHAELVKLVSGNLRNKKQGKKTKAGFEYEPADRLVLSKRLVFTRRKIEQSRLCLGFGAFNRFDERRDALTLLHIALGANMSSRLFNEIREKRGLAYDISTSVRRFNDCGVFLIQAGIRTGKTAEALRLVKKELMLAAAGKITDAEIDRAKEYYIGQLMMGLEDTSENMIWGSERILTRGCAEDPKKIIARIRKVSRTQLKDTAKEIFNGKQPVLSVIGPIPDKEQLEIRKITRGFF